MMTATRVQLEADLKAAQERREATYARAVADWKELQVALAAAETACRKVKADCDRVLAQAQREDERAAQEIARITAALAALPNTSET